MGDGMLRVEINWNTGSPSGAGAWPATGIPRGTGRAGLGWRRGS